VTVEFKLETGLLFEYVEGDLKGAIGANLVVGRVESSFNGEIGGIVALGSRELTLNVEIGGIVALDFAEPSALFKGEIGAIMACAELFKGRFGAVMLFECVEPSALEEIGAIMDVLEFLDSSTE